MKSDGLGIYSSSCSLLKDSICADELVQGFINIPHNLFNYIGT